MESENKIKVTLKIYDLETCEEERICRGKGMDSES